MGALAFGEIRLDDGIVTLWDGEAWVPIPIGDGPPGPPGPAGPPGAPGATGPGVAPITMLAGETIAAGRFVNFYLNAGVTKARLADTSNQAKRAHGFVLSGASAGGSIDVNLVGTDTVLSGLTMGSEYYLSTTGQVVTPAPTTSAYLVQRLGVAVSATALAVSIQEVPIILA
jgi:hypothetical protein